MNKPKQHDLTHARHDPAHCLAPGLFRSLIKGDRKKLKLNVIYEYGHGQRIEFSGPEPLGVDDLRVLQGLIAMAGPSGLMLSHETITESGKQLFQQLKLFVEPKWEEIQINAMVVKGSYRGLASEIGYANIEDSKPIRESIERLWKVSIIVQSGSKRMGFRLLSEYASDDLDGKLHVALNPKIAAAIMGDSPHTRIELAEVRGLKSDPARLIHQRLCGWIDQGKTKQVGIETLVSYVWPDHADGSTHRMRLTRVRKSLEEIKAIGWTVEEYAAKKYNICRPHGNR